MKCLFNPNASLTLSRSAHTLLIRRSLDATRAVSRDVKTHVIMNQRAVRVAEIIRMSLAS